MSTVLLTYKTSLEAPHQCHLFSTSRLHCIIICNKHIRTCCYIAPLQRNTHYPQWCLYAKLALTFPHQRLSISTLWIRRVFKRSQHVGICYILRCFPASREALPMSTVLPLSETSLVTPPSAPFIQHLKITQFIHSLSAHRDLLHITIFPTSIDTPHCLVLPLCKTSLETQLSASFIQHLQITQFIH